MTVNLASFTAAIAALRIAGVTVKDTSGIPDAVNARDCPVLYPEPEQFVTNLTMTRDTFGGSYRSVEYDVIYTYCHAQIGEGRGLKTFVPDNVTALALIVETINTTWFPASGQVQVDAVIKDSGPILDPANAWFHGGHIIIHVREFLEL